mmetsp:Transcript_10989/g.16356  ORF Transcript_10989/g.16356 Transcript_10989/m.16356 type:complete len:469 (-) Transcript_10989:183-1589(-)
MSSGTLPLETYHRAQSLGSGTYGSVLAVYNSSGEEFALKVFIDDDEDPTQDESTRTIDLETLREISILRLLRCDNGHENIVPIADVVTGNEDEGVEEGAGTGGYMSMAMPMYKTGTLEDAIKKGLLKSAGKKAKVYIAHGILCAICYLHENGIIHRDIKADNVMLEIIDDKKGKIKAVLIDFSLAKLVNGAMFTTETSQESTSFKLLNGKKDKETEPTHTGEVGTVTYRAPEIVSSQSYGLKSDLWSVGVICLEMIQNEALPTTKDKDAARLVHEAKETMPDQPFANLVRGLLECDPEKRLSAREALQSEIFQKFGLDEPPRRIINLSEAVPLDGEEDDIVDTGAKGKNKQGKLPQALLRRQKTIQKLCNELECSHPLTRNAAFCYSRQLEQLDDTLDNINESQMLLDCVVLASKFFEKELLDLEELEEEGRGSFSQWSLEEYKDNESTIFMMMDHCLYPRKLVPWDN